MMKTIWPKATIVVNCCDAFVKASSSNSFVNHSRLVLKSPLVSPGATSINGQAIAVAGGEVLS